MPVPTATGNSRVVEPNAPVTGSIVSVPVVAFPINTEPNVALAPIKMLLDPPAEIANASVDVMVLAVVIPSSRCPLPITVDPVNIEKYPVVGDPEVVTVPEPPGAAQAPSPRKKVVLLQVPVHNPITSADAASVIAPVVVVFFTIPVPRVAQFWLLVPSVRVAVLPIPVPPLAAVTIEKLAVGALPAPPPSTKSPDGSAAELAHVLALAK